MRRLHIRHRNLAIVLFAGATLSGCLYGGVGGYGRHGGVSVGIGTGGYYDPYYGDWGYYRSNPYWGWYDGFYYPGTGIYVYDRQRRPYRWTAGHQDYWTRRQAYWRGRDDFRTSRRELRENWRDFQAGRQGTVRQNSTAPNSERPN